MLKDLKKIAKHARALARTPIYAYLCHRFQEGSPHGGFI